MLRSPRCRRSFGQRAVRKSSGKPPWRCRAVLGLALSLWFPAGLHAQSIGNTNATCCATARAAQNLGQIRWHLLRTSLGAGVGDLIFVSPSRLAALHSSYRRYLAHIAGCREVGMAAQKRPTGRPYPYMWLMISAPYGNARAVRVWDKSTTMAQISSDTANVYLVPQVLHVRADSPRHCLVLASPGRWRLLRLKKE